MKLLRLTVNVVRDLYEKLQKVATRRDITETEAIQQALVTYTFIDETLQKGERFFIGDRRGQLREVFFGRIGQLEVTYYPPRQGRFRRTHVPL